MKIISKFLKKHWHIYFFATLLIIISVYLDMLSPQITKSIIDDVIRGGKRELLSNLLLLILAISIGRCIFHYIKEIMFDLVSSKFANTIRKELFMHIQSLSLNFFDKNNTGELMSRVKDDVDRLWGAFGYVIMLIIQVIIHTVIAIFFMVRLSPILTIIPLIILPLVGFLAIHMERKLGKVYEQISEENAKLNTVAQESISGVRTVKAFAREKFEIKKFLSHNKRYYDLNMKQSKVFIKLYPFFQLITTLLPLLVIILGGYMVIQGEISLGTLAAFTEYSLNIVWPMEMIGWLSNDLASAIASYRRIKKIFQENPTIIEEDEPVILDEVRGEIEFKNVSFTVNDSQILKDISFKLPAGKTLGIMGATGAGKSSIINLLKRFYDVYDGEIKLDKVNIKKLSLNQLRKNISLVMQDVFLFSDTINANVKLGKRHHIKQEDVLKAASQSHSKEFIEQMENKYDTIIGERGVGLSGGQKQRISIARAIAKNTPVLVLDDSTSALDMETELLIQKSLLDIDSTKIIIAHRISAVRHADEIIVLDDGKISERGNHESLLKARGYYYRTYMAQYGEQIKGGLINVDKSN